MNLRNTIAVALLCSAAIVVAARDARAAAAPSAPRDITAADNPAGNGTYRLTHGPYLQGLTADGVTVVFTTSERGFSRVEVRRGGTGGIRTCVSVKDGLVAAYDTANAIRLDSLEAATEYEYRIVSTRIDSFEPYRVTYGESVTTP